MGHEGGRPQARRRHRDEPAERRDPRDGQPARRTTTTSSRAGSAATDYQALLNDPEQAARQPRDQRSVPARLDVQARRRHRRPRRRQDHAVDADPDGGLPHARRRSSSATGTAPASACATSTAASATRATRSSTRRRHARHRPARLLGASSTASARRPGIDLPAEAPGIVPTNEWKLDTLGLPIYPGEVYHAGIGQGYDAVTPLQLLNAYAALANGGTLLQAARRAASHRRPTAPSSRVEPEVIQRGRRRPPSTCGSCARPARNVVVDPPHVQPGRPADRHRRQDRHGRSSAPRQRRAAAVPLLVRWLRAQGPVEEASDPNGLKAVERTDSELAVLVFAYDSRHPGQRRDRDRQVLPPAPLRDQEGLPQLRPARSAATSTGALSVSIAQRPSLAPEPLDGRARRASSGARSTCSSRPTPRCCSCFGLAMAYSNTATPASASSTAARCSCAA